jgi:hypothetical protein
MARLPAIPAKTSDPVQHADSLVVSTTSVIGAIVITRDGHRLGRIKDAVTDCVLIDARFAFDYWLSSRAIARVAAGQVHLGIDKRQVGAYLVDRDCLEDFSALPSVTARPVVLHAAS